MRVYEGSLSDQAQGVSWSLRGGVIVMFPSFRIANVTYEGKIRYEEVIASVDGGVFHAPLASDAAAA